MRFLIAAVSATFLRMASPLGLKMIMLGPVSWADADRIGPGYWNGWAFGPNGRIWNPGRNRERRPHPANPASRLIIVLPGSACYFQQLDRWLNAAQNYDDF